MSAFDPLHVAHNWFTDRQGGNPFLLANKIKYIEFSNVIHEQSE
jgi:hypothetical protein